MISDGKFAYKLAESNFIWFVKNIKREVEAWQVLKKISKDYSKSIMKVYGKVRTDPKPLSEWSQKKQKEIREKLVELERRHKGKFIPASDPKFLYVKMELVEGQPITEILWENKEGEGNFYASIQ